jgi:hypothetical protein
MTDWAEDPFADDAAQHSRQANGFDDDIRFQFTQFREVNFAMAPPYTVCEMIPRLGVVVPWGKPKCGKTFWVFDLEMHVALGWSYRGRRVEQGTVLHIACEGVAGLAARKEAWRLHHLKGKTAAEIDFIEAAPFYLCKDTALDLIKDVDQLIADIVAQLAGRPIKVITIDTLNRSLRGSESKDDDMAAYVRAATLLAEKFQCVVLVIHHCGHTEARPRGHSSLIGAVDTLIEIKKDADGAVCTEVEHMRDGPAGATTRSRLQVVEVTRDGNGDPITSCVIVSDAADEASSSTQKTTQRAKKLTGAAAVGLAQLRNCVAKYVTPTPPFDEIPKNAKGVSLDLWRRYLAQTGVINEDGSPREQFRRIRVTLQELGYIGVWGDFVWINN